MPTPTSSKKVTINPKTTDSSSKVGIENLKPGQKIKVTVIEGKSIPSNSKSATPSPKTTSKATPKPVAPKNGFKTTTKAPVKVVPKPSGTKAAVGIENLKPGQKIKVTVKTGGTNK